MCRLFALQLQTTEVYRGWFGVVILPRQNYVKLVIELAASHGVVEQNKVLVV
jgi:hypothetical protein